MGPRKEPIYSKVQKWWPSNFFDALDKSYEGGLFVRSVESKIAVSERSEVLKEAFELGRKAVIGERFHVSK